MTTELSGKVSSSLSFNKNIAIVLLEDVPADLRGQLKQIN